MKTPMDETMDFLKSMETEFAQLQEDHWAWFYDEGTTITPRVHYNQLDERILCLASVLEHKAELIRKEREKEDRKHQQLVWQQRQDMEMGVAEDPDYDLGDGCYEEEEPNPYSGTMSEE